MGSVVSNSKYFEFNPKINREPQELRKNKCNMAEFGRKSQHEKLHQFCTRWSFLISFLANPYSNAITIVK